MDSISDENNPMLKKNGGVGSGLSALDKAILDNRERPLTEEELKAFGRKKLSDLKPPRIMPIVRISSDGEGLKAPVNVVVGIRGTF